MMPVGVIMLTRQRQAACDVTHPVKLLLQFFVGVVDAELFEAVALKRLEPAPTEKSSRKLDSCFHNYQRLKFLPLRRHKVHY